MKSRLLVFAAIFPLLALAPKPFVRAAAPEERAEVIVYGGTPAGVMAAIAAARQGHDVALIDINAHVGGMVSGGLTATDMGDRKTVGGLADDFFKRIVKYYTEKFGADSPQLKACRNGATFEPHVAELVFDQMLAEQPRIRLWRRHRYRAVTIDSDRSTPGQRVTALIVDDLATQTVRTFTGSIFIDASYEGDVMAGARVPYRVGREARAEFGEQLAGVSMGPKEQRGLGDHRTQAYNYRVSVTSNTANRVLFPKPENYDPSPLRPDRWEADQGGPRDGFWRLFHDGGQGAPEREIRRQLGRFSRQQRRLRRRRLADARSHCRAHPRPFPEPALLLPE